MQFLKRWDKFKNVVENVKLACENSNNVGGHFSQVGK